MKHLLLTTIAAVLVVGCGESVPDISIHEAANKGNIEVVKQHLADGADVNAENEDGWTPLLHAAGYGHKEIAELLIDKGADVNAIIVSGHLKGQTSLDFASVLKSTELANLLRKHGAKPGEELKSKEK